MYKYDDFFFFFLLTICQAFHCRYNPVRKVLCKTADGTNIKQIFIYKYRKKKFKFILIAFSPALFFRTTMPCLLTLNMLQTMCLGLKSLALRTPSKDWSPRTLCKLFNNSVKIFWGIRGGQIHHLNLLDSSPGK